MAETKRERLRKLVAALKNERSSFDSHWRELAEFLKPRRTRFTASDRNRGDRRSQKIVDSTATYALRTLASGMMSGITSPARPWFRLTTPDPADAEQGGVKDWLHVTTEVIRAILLRSNWYNALPTMYSDMGAFGTGCMLMAEDDESVLRCYPFAVGSYYLANDSKLRVRVFAREFQMTTRQLVERFGRDNVSNRVRDAWDRGSYEDWHDVAHVIYPNADHDPDRLDGRYKRYAECYYEGSAESNRAGEGEESFLLESGYDEWPILSPRWEVTGEDVYGTDCPGMTALGDVKALQQMKRWGLQAVEKMVKPPMVASPAMRSSKLSILPGDVSYVQEGQHQTFRPAHPVDLNINDLRQETAEVRQLIRRAFYEDLFLLISQMDDTQRTATEIIERREEKLLALGPVLEQLNQDALDPGIDRAFALAERRGLIPEPPEELYDVPLKVEYESIMAQAQKAIGLGGLERFATFLTTVVAAFPNDPSVADKPDIDQIFDEYAKASGLPPRVVRSDEDVAAMRAQRAERQAAAEEAALVEQAAGAAQKLGQTPMGQGSALDAILGNAEGLAAAGAPV